MTAGALVLIALGVILVVLLWLMREPSRNTARPSLQAALVWATRLDLATKKRLLFVGGIVLFVIYALLTTPPPYEPPNSEVAATDARPIDDDCPRRGEYQPGSQVEALGLIPVWIPRWPNVQHPITFYGPNVPGGTATLDPRVLGFMNVNIAGGTYHFFEASGTDQSGVTVARVKHAFRQQLLAQGFTLSLRDEDLVGKDPKTGRQMTLHVASKPACSDVQFQVTWKAGP
jgi:hypothetical protein